MFSVEGNKITLSKGDTGAVKIVVSGYTFGADDRCLFTMKSGNGTIVKQKAYAMTNNEFVVSFLNAETDTLVAGNYSWDVRWVIHPYYDSAGRIVDGDQVLTPELPMGINLLTVVGDI